ncbi:MAG: hypothetical protein H7066_10590 [Cytophagaceae bacterium]|nr:hypothetical protein [Gemmatimonadaceae bacterium]
MATAPVMLDGMLYRVLAFESEQRFVQEWSHGYWMPSLLPLYRVGDAMIATTEHLRRLGVPEADWHGSRGRWPDRPRDDATPSAQG